MNALTLPEKFQLLHKSIQSYFNRNIKNNDISAGHVFYFLLLSKSSMTQAELTKHCKHDKAHTNRVVTHLLEKGYIEYQEIDGKKSKKLCLTQIGREFSSLCKKTLEEYIKKLTAGIDKKELEQTASILNRLELNAEKLRTQSEDNDD